MVVGEMNVGKSALIARFTKGEFNPKMQNSVGVAYAQKTITVENVTCKLSLWDTVGQEKFRSINAMYYRNAAAGIIVYDVTDLRSFNEVPYWLDRLRTCAVKNCVITVVGNKCDVDASKRQVSEEMGDDYCTGQGVAWCEVSAKTGAGISALFSRIAREAPRYLQGADEASRAENGFRVVKFERAGSKVIGSDSPQAPSSGCCGGGGGSASPADAGSGLVVKR